LPGSPVALFRPVSALNIRHHGDFPSRSDLDRQGRYFIIDSRKASPPRARMNRRARRPAARDVVACLIRLSIDYSGRTQLSARSSGAGRNGTLASALAECADRSGGGVHCRPIVTHDNERPGPPTPTPPTSAEFLSARESALRDRIQLALTARMASRPL